MTDSSRADHPALLLFDIDGTLLQGASREHALALRQAMQTVHGVDTDGVRLQSSAAGRTDGEIARLILLGAGISAERIDERAPAVADECCRVYAEICPEDLSGYVVPGIPQLLQTLAARGDVRLALLTGNYEPVARIKLKAAGIGRWFEPGQGGFGSDSEDRARLPEVARDRAGAALGAWPRERTIVIGDTPRDIACARADQVRVIAVTTGPHAADELAGADAVTENSDALQLALEQML